MRPLIALTITATAALAVALAGQKPKRDQPVEVGDVAWGRDLESALGKSKKSAKPVLVLFQEVPGCAGCKKFGGDVLTDPLLVEAIEDEFLPVLVHNNKKGPDAELLARFKEPAWNYQVIRFLDGEAKDIIPRKDRVWSKPAVAARMVSALEAADRDVPGYLRALAPAGKTSTAVFSMHCFWTGEYELGKIDGVVNTEAGWFDGHEVTRVEYLSDEIELVDLVKKAAAVKCARKVYLAGKDERDEVAELKLGLEIGELDKSYKVAKKSDQKKQVESLKLEKKVPGLTAFQHTKLNSFLRKDRKKALSYLSPRQRKALVGK